MNMNVHMQTIRRTVSLAALFAMVALAVLQGRPALATDAEKITNTTNVYGAHIAYPAPGWIFGEIDPTQLLEMSEHNRQHTGDTFVLEQIPKGQSFKDWRSIYAITGIKLKAGAPTDKRFDAIAN